MPRHKFNRVFIIVFTLAAVLHIIFPLTPITSADVLTSQGSEQQSAIVTLQPNEEQTPAQTEQAQVQPPDAQVMQDPAGQPDLQAVQPASASEPSKKLSEEELAVGIKIDKKRISLDLKGIDVIELFRILSLKMNVTIVPTKSVTGRVNIFLNNLTFEDALDVVLISQGLACERKGNMINIMTESEYEKLYGQKYNEKRKFLSVKLNYAKPSTIFNAISQVRSDIGKIIADETTGMIILIDVPDRLKLMEGVIKDLDKPLETEYFDIGYAKAADMKTHLSTAITPGAGELYVDERSGSIVVSDLPDKMKKIKRIIKAFDKETQQVFIEAEIVQVLLTDQYQRGIDWENLIDNLNFHGLDIAGEFPVSPSFTPSPAITTAYGKITIGTVAQDDYTATIKMLQTYGDIKILSRPRIAAINNQEAKILVGTRDAYITQTLSQGDTTTITSESVQFIDVGIKLNVVPTINRDGFVTMKIKPEVSSVGDTITTEAGSRIPIVDTSEAETAIKVKDGVMIMIAGLMKEEKRSDRVGLPLLSRIPFLGKIFDSYASQKKRTELVIFITPHIITGDTIHRGMEFEKHIPADMLSDEMKDELISKRIGEITAGVKSGDAADTPAVARRTKENASVAAIQEKMKGLKGY